MVYLTPSGAITKYITISNINPGDIVFFKRNMTGIITIGDNNTVCNIIAPTLVSNITYNINTKILTFTRESQYSGSLVVLSNEKVTITYSL